MHGNSRESLGTGRANTYRLFCLAASILVIALREIASPDNSYDPLWLRLVVGGYFIGLILASYLSPWVTKRMNSFFAGGIIGLSMWLAFLLWKNQFQDVYMSGYYIMSVASSLLFSNRRHTAWFTGAASLSLVVAALTSPITHDNVWPFVAINVAIYVISNVAVSLRARARRNLEYNLGRSLAMQEAAVESSSDAILMVDEEGNYIKGNVAFLRMWNIPPEMIVGNNHTDTYAIAMSMVSDVDTLVKIWSNPGGNLGIGELKNIEFLDGRMIEVYWRPMIHVDELIGRIWYFRDITDRWNNEQLLVGREKLLRRQNEMLMDFAAHFTSNAGNLEVAFKEVTLASTDLLSVDTVGVWFFDETGESMRLALQYDRLTAEYTRDVRVRLADHTEYFQALFKSRVLAVSDTEQHPTTAEFSKGKYSGKAAALMHAQIRARGECIGVLSFECAGGAREWTSEELNYASSLADLVSISIATEEKQHAQDKLSSSLAILQAIFDLSETGIIVEDNEHNILNYNELYLKTFNMTKEFIDHEPYKVLVQHCLAQLKNSHSYEEGLEKLKLRPGMEYAGIMEFHDGRFVERYSKAINVGGDLKGRVWFYLDITDRKRKENELINRNFELDSFVYRASHDLKAPLNSIMGLISLIREEQNMESILTYIGMMDKSAQKLDDFIKQLTQFSQDVRLKMVCKSIKFQEMVDDILEVLKFMDNAARLEVRVDVQQEGVYYSDPVRLGIVVSNLVSNAIKYQDLKKKRSTLEIIVRADEHEARIEFRDNGVGISPEHIDRVFDLFFRASVQASGTGLGLYITHNAVQKLGGELSVESTLGVGTAFTLVVPSLKESDLQEQNGSPLMEPQAS
jgi:PAS domain S-box-containing protein